MQAATGDPIASAERAKEIEASVDWQAANADYDPELNAIAEKAIEDGLAAPTREVEPLVHEAAHAEVLAHAWRGLYRWAVHEGTWRRWSGQVWEVAGEPQVVAAAQSELRRHYGQQLAARQSKADDKRLLALHVETCRYQSVLAGLAFLKGADGFYTDFEAWDADPYALNCADGILDVRTQTLRPHDPEALCTRIARWSYSDETTTGAWQHHLSLCLPSAEVRRQVQRDLGRALVDAVLEHSLPIWYGVGRNGKSTTQDALQQGFDGYSRQAAKNLLMASKYERHTTEIAELAGSRLVFSEEIAAGRDLDEAQVKKLTGGGPQTARFMRQDNFTFKQTFSIFLLTNHHPVVAGTDRAIWARLRLVPWTVSIPFAQQRPQDEVVAELLADGSWMLRWMAAGFADWQADHHWIAEEVQVATAAYRAEQDRLAGFIADVCEERLHATAEIADLYAAYEAWCRASDELTLGKVAFGKALRERGFGQTRIAHGPRVWTGIRLQNGGKVTEGDKNSISLAQDDLYRDEPEKLSPSVTRGAKGVFF
jgi:putative DNA primase/helicase